MANENEVLDKVTMKTNEFTYVGDDINSIYANHVNLQFSLWDVAVNFGEILGSAESKPVILHKAKITMSKELAKVLNMLLAARITEYEAANGEIKIPDVKIKVHKGGAGSKKKAE